jgi:anthranilate phosphoribosyltransferase
VSRASIAISPTLATLIREMGGGAGGARDLGEENAYALLAAILAGEFPAAELGAVSGALQSRGASLIEMRGFMRALDAHVGRLEAPADRPRPVILPTGSGARRQPNLTALLALLLKRYGVPVLIHGPGRGEVEVANDTARDGGTDPAASATRIRRVTTLEILLELGIEPSTSLADTQGRLAQTQIVYAPAAVLAPGLVPLLHDRARPGVRSFARSLLKLIDPFGGDGYRVVSATPPENLPRTRAFLAATRADALLLRGAEGEPFANPRRQPQLEAFAKGSRSVCAEKESGILLSAPAMPAVGDAPATAAWIAQALAGGKPVPVPIIAQLACCLEGARRAITVV